MKALKAPLWLAALCLFSSVAFTQGGPWCHNGTQLSLGNWDNSSHEWAANGNGCEMSKLDGHAILQVSAIYQTETGSNLNSVYLQTGLPWEFGSFLGGLYAPSGSF